MSKRKTALRERSAAQHKKQKVGLESKNKIKNKNENENEIRDRLVFYGKARDSLPGKSRSKLESVQDPRKYKKLALIPHWRRILSTLFPLEIEIDGKTFTTAEHYLQFRKCCIANPEKAFLFSRESKSELGLSDGIYARRKGKTLVKLNKDQWQKWKDIIEPEAKEKVRQIKFCSVKKGIAYSVLMATQNAELWSSVPRCGTFRMFNLEKIRDQHQKVAKST
jgi:predicted NAD-dependent protein-ADP-ribosyltransferase YbiA (DUF1768 family)